MADDMTDNPRDSQSRPIEPRQDRRAPQVPKICGFDIELGSFILDPREAARVRRTGADAKARGGFFGRGALFRAPSSLTGFGPSAVAARASDPDELSTGYEASRRIVSEVPGVDAGGPIGLTVLGGTEVRGMPDIPGRAVHDPVSTTDLIAEAQLIERYAADIRGFDERTWNERDYGYDPRDCARKFLTMNGGCIYIDLGHPEIATPETWGADDAVAALHAMLIILRFAAERAERRLPRGESLEVLVNNSDGRGQSYGSHLSMLVTRQMWDNLFRRKLHHLLTLASYLVSSIVYTGTGKVGRETDGPEVDFQISQRAEFFSTLVGHQTTFDRPLMNCRDESHATFGLARLHMIPFDSTLSHGATFLKVGVTQLVVAMIEAEWPLPDGVILDDPVQALHDFTADPTLRATAERVNGKTCTAVELQRDFHAAAERFVAEGLAEGIVPRADEIVEYWGDTLDKLERDPELLAGRIDWILKQQLIEQAREEQGVPWDSPELRYLDQIFHSLDLERGLFWRCDAAGALEHVVTPDAIDRFVHEPPRDTRAYTRAHLLRRVADEDVDAVDWSSLRVRVRRHDFLAFERVELECPYELGAADTAHLFEPEHGEAGDGSEPLDLAETIDGLREVVRNKRIGTPSADSRVQGSDPQGEGGGR